MTKISVELIPRDKNTLEEETRLIKDKFPLVNAINIPDLLRFDTRSWQAVELTSKLFPFSVPHIRAIDFPADDFNDSLEKSGFIKSIKESNSPAVLVVRGDEPKDKSHKVYDTNSIELISFLKKTMPEIKVYGAIDPYRSTFEEELDYIKEKVDCGADGFFTQPFFDISLMEKYGDKLDSLFSESEIFWGVSPVTTEHSKHYWTALNKVPFPDDFCLTLKCNVDFAKKALAFIKERNSNIYFMPIKVDIDEYLTAVFSE